MKLMGLDQWDEIYPTRQTFVEDIQDRALYIGEAERETLGCVTLSGHQEPEYETVSWLVRDSPTHDSSDLGSPRMGL